MRAPTLLGVMRLLLHDPVAHWLVVAAAGAVVVGEVVATYLGQARDGGRRLLGSLADLRLLYVRRGAAARLDRGTRWIIVLAVYLGIAAALEITKVPGLRAYANDWWTLGLGIAIGLAGVALRAWAILSLGRYFRPEVTIEPGQRLVRRGPIGGCATLRTPASFSSSPVSGLPSGVGSERPAHRRCRDAAAHSGRGTRASPSVRCELHGLRELDGARASPSGSCASAERRRSERNTI